MTHFSNYQELSRKTRKASATDVYCSLNLAGEVGELLSIEAKAVRDGPKPEHKDLIFKELGDILWQVAAKCDDYGFDMDEVARGNLKKLADRDNRGVISGSGDNR